MDCYRWRGTGRPGRLKGEGWLEIYDLTYNGQELGVLKLKGEAEHGRNDLKRFLSLNSGRSN